MCVLKSSWVRALGAIALGAIAGSVAGHCSEALFRTIRDY